MLNANSSKYLRLRFQVLAMMSIKFPEYAELFGRQIQTFLQAPSTKLRDIAFLTTGQALICQIILELNFVSAVVSSQET
jgi:hypothetical protein